MPGLAPVAGTRVALPPESARKARLVLRMRPGENATLFDGRGTDWEARLVRSDADGVEFELVGPAADGPDTAEIELLVCLLKAGRTDWVVQKATELGVRRIVPVVSRRTVVRPGARDAAKRAARLRAVAAQACAQSGRAHVPEIAPITPFEAAIQELRGTVRLLLDSAAHERVRDVLPAASDVRPIVLLVGPEGGFDPEESALAVREGWRPVSLGSATLRAETAPIVAAAAILALRGHLA